VALARAGKRVLAVSCDLRRPRLHRFFGLDNAVGVTSVLTGQASLPEALQRPDDLSLLRVLASGPVPPNPAELLGSPMMDDLLGHLRSAADYILLDTAPLLAVADGLVVGPRCDGVIVVVDAGSTRRGAAKAAREQLEQVDARVLGGIFNNFDAARAKYYYSGDYRTSYPYAQEEDDDRRRSAGGTSEAVTWTTEDIWR
jgi:capsular exopolysaccharide synthesis family protein